MRPDPHLAYNIGALTANLIAAEEALSRAFGNALNLETWADEDDNPLIENIQKAQRSVGTVRSYKPSWHEKGKKE